MIYEARTNFADERPLHVYTEEQFKNSYNRTQRDSIKKALGQEKNRYGFYWKLGDEKTTESGHTINILTRDGIPYTREDMVELGEFSKYLILALKPEIEQKDGGFVIRGETLREFITEEGIEEMERRHYIEGYNVMTFEEYLAMKKNGVEPPANYYELGWELQSLLMSYDIDSEGNAYSFKKYWQRCNLDKKVILP